jgi:ElaB/YqjD/DUF883 family membrane-anchored ribosome-binding protein
MSEATVAAREQLISDLRAVVADSEELLKATAGDLNERASAARAKVQESLRTAREKIAQLDDEVLERIQTAAKSTDQYVREHPWGAVGIAAAAGVLVGVLIARR